MKEPLERIVMDITYLPNFLISNSKFKYILNIIDHFSKYLVSYLINKKDASVIVEKLKLYFIKYGIPKQIGTDNGSEFVNKKVINLLANNNIEFVRGKPYNPHSQGVVERVHRSVRTGLICKYLEDKKNFDINKSLFQVINSYNNVVHSTTKKKPIDVFFSNDKNLFNNVF